MEGIMFIYLICYTDMTLVIVCEDPNENCHGKFGSLIKYYYYYDNHHHHYYYYLYYYHDYIVIKIILFFSPLKSNQFCKTIHKRRVE